MKLENLEVASDLWSELVKINQKISDLDDALSDENQIDFKVHPIHEEEDDWLGLDEVGLGEQCGKAVKKILQNRRKAIEQQAVKL
jgi:hypothetical protein